MEPYCEPGRKKRSKYTLYMEHLNRRLKYMIGNLSSNACPSSIQRVAKSLKVVNEICEVFKSQAEVMEEKGHVTYPSFESDFKKILQQIEDKVFTLKENRSLENYSYPPLLNNIKWNNIKTWIKDKIINMNVY